MQAGNACCSGLEGVTRMGCYLDCCGWPIGSPTAGVAQAACMCSWHACARGMHGRHPT